MTAFRRTGLLTTAHARLLASVMVGAVTFSANALAQSGPNPFPEPIKPTEKPAPKAAPKAAAPKPKAEAPKPKKSEPAKSATPAPAPVAPDDPNKDLAYGAYQQGLYRTAFNIALKRAQEMGDPRSMTLLGELYSNALGIKRDDAKAAEWYKQAADRGDREAMFALGMMRIAGRGGPANREEGARLLASSAKLGKAARLPTISACFISKARPSRRMSSAPPNCSVRPPMPAIPKRSTRLPPSTRKAAACRRISSRRHGSCGGSAGRQSRRRGRIRHRTVQRHRHAEETRPTAIALLNRAARQNSPIAQNRLARVLSMRLGVPVDKVEGFKWHLIAKTAGNGDPDLDSMLAQLQRRSTAPRPRTPPKMVRHEMTPVLT
jgi:TPR repeat protein